MSGMTNITVLGNVVAEPEIKAVKDGELMNIRIAANIFAGGKKQEGQFYRVTTFRKRDIEFHKNFQAFCKGAKILVNGSFYYEVKKTDDGKTFVNTNIDANDIQPAGNKGDQAPTQPTEQPTTSASTPTPAPAAAPAQAPGDDFFGS